MFKVQLDIGAREGGARTGVAATHRGTYETPCFMPVGTRGAIKYLSARDYAELGARIVLETPITSCFVLVQMSWNDSVGSVLLLVGTD